VHAGRVGVSQLSCLGLQDLIGATPDEYVAIATRLALDPVRLQDLRRNLRPRMAAAPLTDAARFTADLEQAYRAMWTDWCA
jgi:predicted O-linked N-acetylglucosamine transferase (SPINDLY family)